MHPTNRSLDEVLRNPGNLEPLQFQIPLRFFQATASKSTFSYFPLSDQSVSFQ